MEDGPSFFKKAINGGPPRSREHRERYGCADPTRRRQPPLEIANYSLNPGRSPEKQVAEEIGPSEMAGVLRFAPGPIRRVERWPPLETAIQPLNSGSRPEKQLL